MVGGCKVLAGQSSAPNLWHPFTSPGLFRLPPPSTCARKHVSTATPLPKVRGTDLVNHEAAAEGPHRGKHEVDLEDLLLADVAGRLLVLQGLVLGALALDLAKLSALCVEQALEHVAQRLSKVRNPNGNQQERTGECIANYEKSHARTSTPTTVFEHANTNWWLPFLFKCKCELQPHYIEQGHLHHTINHRLVNAGTPTAAFGNAIRTSMQPKGDLVMAHPSS